MALWGRNALGGFRSLQELADPCREGGGDWRRQPHCFGSSCPPPRPAPPAASATPQSQGCVSRESALGTGKSWGRNRYPTRGPFALAASCPKHPAALDYRPPQPLGVIEWLQLGWGRALEAQHPPRPGPRSGDQALSPHLGVPPTRSSRALAEGRRGLRDRAPCSRPGPRRAGLPVCLGTVPAVVRRSYCLSPAPRAEEAPPGSLPTSLAAVWGRGPGSPRALAPPPQPWRSRGGSWPCLGTPPARRARPAGRPVPRGPRCAPGGGRAGRSPVPGRASRRSAGAPFSARQGGNRCLASPPHRGETPASPGRHLRPLPAA